MQYPDSIVLIFEDITLILHNIFYVSEKKNK